MFPLFLRRTLPLILIAGSLSLATMPVAHAASDGSAGSAVVDVNFFYDTLKDDGSWYNTSEYGDVWQPYIAYKSDSWRPYTDGYWSYTDGGWMFVSNENFGWAVYHYGRWTRLKDIGWAWVPGTDWAPAWVTWRASKTDNNGPPDAATGPAPTAPDDKAAPPPDNSSAPPPAAPSGAPVSQNYVGWAPLPPERVAYTDVDYAYGPTVDVDYGIDPYDYCFTDERYFGAPYVAAVIFNPFDSFYYADHSVNITNVYYNRSNRYNGFYAGGPDFNRLRGVSQHPIPQYDLHQTSGAAAQRAIRNGKFNSIQGNSIGVPAPKFSHTGVGQDGRVKLTRAGALAKAEVAHGAPAAAASNPAYNAARESFAKQNDAYRSTHPNTPVSRAAALDAAGKGGAVPETASKIQTTERAQTEERNARQAAGENVPSTGTKTETRADAIKEHETGEGAAKTTTSHRDTASDSTAGETRHSRHGGSHSTESTGGGEGRHTSSSSGHTHTSSAPHVERSAPKIFAPPAPRGGGGGGGEKHDDGKKKK